MLLWEVRALNGQDCRRGWIVAFSGAEAQDIARLESVELIGEPIEWYPGHGARVFWKSGPAPSEVMH